VADTFTLLGGNDVVLGLEGEDIIYAGAGNDSVDAGAGNDVVFGGLGNDVLIGGGGDKGDLTDATYLPDPRGSPTWKPRPGGRCGSASSAGGGGRKAV
jgi:Ca2+-binding RTX toxin-like protein